MLSSFLRNALMSHAFKGTAYTQPTNLYVALSTADPKDDNSGLAEPAGNGYARVAFNTWTISANTASNNGAVTFPQATGSWGTIAFTAVFDALTLGNLLWRAPLCAAVYPFVARANTSTFYTEGAGTTFTNGTIVRMYGVTASIPGGFLPNTLYYVINSAVGDDESFQLSLTSGGAAVTVSADGKGFIGVDASKAIGLNDTPSFASGQLTYKLE